ncbi:hypothetical protein AB4148_15415 [Vibrio sp. 10N.286.51.F4]|uniref:hypothetical protein n=1 Tax=Vibrio sp. 10N.286.51.F4 TaxID=3229710 RepID=UPI00354CFD58
MNKKKSIWIVLFEDFEVDGRVQRQVLGLKNDYNVKVFSCSHNSERKYYLDSVLFNLGSKYGFFSPMLNLFRLLKLRESKPDIIYVNNIYTVPSLILFKLMYPKAKFIYDSHELIVPDPKTNKSIASRKSIFLEWIATRVSDLVISTNSCRSNLMQDYYNLKSLPIAIENFVDLPHRNRDVTNFQINSITKYVYQGVLKPGRYLEEMIETFAAIRVKDKNHELHILGFGPIEKALIDKAHSLGVLNTGVFFHGKKSRNELYEETPNFDVGLVIYDFSNMNNRYCSPNKTSEYVLSGLPILCTPQESLVKLVEEHCIGACFERSALDHKDIASLVETIINFTYSLPSYKSNIAESKTNFDFINESKKLIDGINEIF